MIGQGEIVNLYKGATSALCMAYYLASGGGSAAADGQQPQPSMAEAVNEVYSAILSPTNFNAPQHIVIDAESGRPLLALHPDEQRQPASLVKVMTLWLAMDAIADNKISLSIKITIPDNVRSLADGAFGTQRPGGTASLRYFMQKSGGRSDAHATIAVAVAVAKAQGWAEKGATARQALDVFVDKMNAKAQRHGMTRTVFGNVTGMRDNYSTPRDMARMFAQLYKDYPEEFTASMGGKSHSSRFQRNFDSAVGSKTGTLNECGLCLGSVYTKGDRTFVMIIFGMDSYVKRYGWAKNLYAETPELPLPLNGPIPQWRPEPLPAKPNPLS